VKTTTAFAVFSLALCCASVAYADTFGSGSNTFDIDFITIGNPGNADDPDDGDSDSPGIQNFGSVDYIYRIGQFEISEDMIDKANTLGGLSITHDGRGANKPATSITWFEAAKFVNWLNGNTPAYKFDGGGNFQLWQSGDAGYNPNNLYRNSLATYFLPSVDEWYKAAYYDPTAGLYYDYATGSDTVPTAVASGTATGTAVYDQSFATGPADITLAGGLSPYGTMGQSGNAWESEETSFDLTNNGTLIDRGFRGGGWSFNAANQRKSTRGGRLPSFHNSDRSFRVASVIPEPSSLLLGALASMGMMLRRRCSAI